MKIPLSGLKKEEIEEFNKSRSDFTNVNYIDSASRISDLVENKLRAFIFSVYLLQFGDWSHRKHRIPIKLHTYIEKNPITDIRRGYQTSSN
jgi:hypothetical protein